MQLGKERLFSFRVEYPLLSWQLQGNLALRAGCGGPRWGQPMQDSSKHGPKVAWYPLGTSLVPDCLGPLSPDPDAKRTPGTNRPAAPAPTGLSSSQMSQMRSWWSLSQHQVDVAPAESGVNPLSGH